MTCAASRGRTTESGHERKDDQAWTGGGGEVHSGAVDDAAGYQRQSGAPGIGVLVAQEDAKRATA